MVCRSQHSARARQIALTCESLSSRLRIRWRGARRGGYQRSESRAEALRVPPPPAWRAACEAAAASPSRSAQAGAFTRRENCLRHQCNSVDSVDIFQGSDLGPMTSPIGSNVEFTALTQATTLNLMYQALPVYGVRASKAPNASTLSYLAAPTLPAVSPRASAHSTHAARMTASCAPGSPPSVAAAAREAAATRPESAAAAPRRGCWPSGQAAAAASSADSSSGAVAERRRRRMAAAGRQHAH